MPGHSIDVRLHQSDIATIFQGRDNTYFWGNVYVNAPKDTNLKWLPQGHLDDLWDGCADVRIPERPELYRFFNK